MIKRREMLVGMAAGVSAPLAWSLFPLNAQRPVQKLRSDNFRIENHCKRQDQRGRLKAIELVRDRNNSIYDAFKPA
jgi:hypothetical protein